MKKKVKKIPRWIYWTPRILSIIFISFLALMSLDVFEGNYGFWGTILGLFMHNIPVFILLALLLISWKHELVGAITFTSAGLLYIVITALRKPFEWYMLSWIIQISGIAFFIGILFFVNWKLRRKKSKKQIALRLKRCSL